VVSGRVNAVVDFPLSSPLPASPARIEIIQCTYRHDMAVLTYYVETAWWKNRFKQGSPVVVTWGYSPLGLDSFFGKVLYNAPNVENERHELRVVCIGTSFRLKDVDPVVHEGMSVEQSLALTLRGQKFNLITDSSSATWPSLTRTVRETTWEYMVRVAKRAGHTMFCNKTTVCIFNPVDVILANLASYPVFDYVYGRGNQFGTLVTFRPKLSDNGAGSLSNLEQRSAGVDPRTGQVVLAVDSGARMRRINPVTQLPLFSEYTEHPVHSHTEAQAIATGRKKAARWVMSASARAYGNVRVTQGSGVLLRGLNAQDDGPWYVDKVVHELTTDDHPQQWRYFMDMELLRDSRQQQAAVPDLPRPLRTLVSVAGLQSSRQDMQPRLIEGDWVAPHATTTVVAV
jgi:hypothetical protein